MRVSRRDGQERRRQRWAVALKFTDAGRGCRPALSAEQVADRLLHHFLADVGDGGRERNVLGTNLDAVLRVAAFLNAAIAHEGSETFALECLTGGVRVEEAHLADGGGADEAGVLVELRAGFHTAAAGDA